jgi:hypothetical protein
MAARRKDRDESQSWKRVAREVLLAGDLMLYGHEPSQAARIALVHLHRGRALMQPIIDRYVADARTPPGRAWRRRRAAQGAYVQAFEQAINHAAAQAAGEPEGTRPILYSRGSLPLIDRYTGDRRVLDDADNA